MQELIEELYNKRTEEVSSNWWGQFQLHLPISVALSHLADGELIAKLPKLQNSFQNFFSQQTQYPAWMLQPFADDATTTIVNDQFADGIVELQGSEIHMSTTIQQIFKRFGTNNWKFILLLQK